MMCWGIYVHIPFCRRKCFYCDFPSIAGGERWHERYTSALIREITEKGSLSFAGEPAESVYIGGGTPTALPGDMLAAIMAALQKNFAIANEAEFTVEANPGTIDASYLQKLYAGGANRLSLGVQSFDDALLKRLGRLHTAQEARDAVKAAQAIGFRNISLDLMYGLPGQSLANLKASVQAALGLGVNHISIYGLTVEPGTAFSHWQAQGKLNLPGDDEAEAMYDYMVEELPHRGYARYEISNFAPPGYESRHNLGYWQSHAYLGLGAAAHSYWQGERRENARRVEEYIGCIETGRPVSHLTETMTTDIAMSEFCFLALRTAVGLSKQKFAQRFGCPLESVYAGAIGAMKNKKLLSEDENCLRLTKLGAKYGNIVFAAFLR